MKDRVTVSLDQSVAVRVRQCGARTCGGASAYLERLVRQDSIREAAESAAKWYAQHLNYAAASADEAEAALDESA
jgi:hypothetical protein